MSIDKLPQLLFPSFIDVDGPQKCIVSCVRSWEIFLPTLTLLRLFVSELEDGALDRWMDGRAEEQKNNNNNNNIKEIIFRPKSDHRE